MALLLKNLLFTVVVPGTAAIYLPLYIVGDRVAADGLARAVGVAMLGVGVSIYLWCVYDFATFGRGTPAPIDAPKKLVVRGLYRFTRNPMYVGVLTTILGWAVFYRAPVLVGYALTLGLGFHAFVIGYEEPHLRDVFGEEYEDYKARVARWVGF
jgi:protein-S-isoprenylcysteine O-methyltransferase Ste14